MNNNLWHMTVPAKWKYIRIYIKCLFWLFQGCKFDIRLTTDRSTSSIKRSLNRWLYDFEIFLIIMYVTISYVPTRTDAKLIWAHMWAACATITRARVCVLEIYSMQRVRTFQRAISIYRLQSGCRPRRILSFIGDA